MNGIDMAAVNRVALGSLESLLARWLPDGKREGREWVARNPTRSDTHLGSFKTNLDTGIWCDFATGDKGGDVVSLYAYLEGVKQGEAAGRLAQELGLGSLPYVGVRPDAQAKWTPLTPVPANTPPPRAHPRHGQPTRVWTYHDAQGAVLCYVYRFDLQGGKQILPLTFCRNTATGQTVWRWQALFSPRPLYNLDKLTANPQATVIICEGEKAAEACSELFPECVSTTTLNGAQSPHKTDFSPLQGRIVWICPDHDEPGRKYAEHVVELLKGIAREVKYLHIPGDHPKGWDLADALKESWRPEDGYTLEVADPVERAKASLEGLNGQDPGAWFEDKPLEALTLLSSSSKPDFERAIHQARKAKVSLKDLKDEVKRRANGRIKEPIPVPRAEERFTVNDQGVWYHPPHDPDEDSKARVWICSPLYVTAYTRNNDNEAWGKLLEFKDAEGRDHTWPMPMRLLQADGSEYRAVLADMGLGIATGRRAHERLSTYLQSARPAAWVRCVERTGWQGTAFVFPDETLGDTGGERVLLQTINGSRHVYRQAGTLEDWKREVARLCVGNSRLVFSVSCAFASMLLGITRDENGGFHFRGISSQGKTTALAVASSVFGQGDLGQRGYIQTWRATGNGLEAVASLHNDALLCLDEIKQVDPREVGEIAYMLASGKGKGRAEKNYLARERQTWRILFLSSGEISLADHIRSAGKRVDAGQEVRLADIPADTGKYGMFEALHGYEDGAAFSLAACQAAQTYYGVATREFLRRLTARDPAAGRLSKDLDDLRREFLAYYVPEGASGQVQRVALRFTLVAFGGELATRLGITGWRQCEALSAAAACFKAWLEARGGAGDLETQAALSQVRRFFELHGESRFTPWGDTVLSDDSRTTYRAGFRRVNENSETEFYMFPEVFKAEICAGFDSRYVAGLLVEKGLVYPDKYGRTVTVHRLPGMKPLRLYHFTPSILGEE